MIDSKNAYARVHTALAIASLAGLLGGSLISGNVALAQTTDQTPPAETPPATGPTAEDVAAGAPTPPDGTTTAVAPDGTPETTTTTTVPGGTTVVTTAPTSDAAALGGETATTTTVAADGTTVTTTVPASGNADEVAEEVQADREPLAWRNSYFNYSVASNFCAFSRDCQLSYNPTVYTWISLSPRWYLDPETFFSFYLPTYIEHTNDDSATYQHEFQVLDLRVSLNHRFALGDNFLLLIGGSAWAPLSKGSQAAQRYVRLGGSVSATWNPNVGGFNLSAQAGYLHWFAGSNVPLTMSPYPAWTPGGTGPDAVSNQASGTTSEVDRVSAGITANWSPLEGFTITLQIFYFWLQGWGLGTTNVPVMGIDGSVLPVADTSPTHWRAFDSYSIYFQYDFVPWLQGYIGFSNSTQLAQVFNDNGTPRSPVNLFDMQATLGVYITLDSLYESVAASGEDDGLTPEQRQRRRQGLARRSTSGGSL